MLQQIATSESAAAEQTAQQIVAQIMQLGSRIVSLRRDGVPGQPAQEARAMPNGQVMPGRPAVPGVSAEAINTALGVTNCAILDGLKNSLGL